MSETTALVNGKEQTITALGKEWQVSRLTTTMLDQLLEWAKPRVVTSLQILKDSGILKDLAPEAAVQAIREALAECPTVVSIRHPLFDQAINQTTEGQVEQFFLQLQPNHPNITRDEVLMIFAEIGRNKREAAGEQAEVPAAV